MYTKQELQLIETLLGQELSALKDILISNSRLPPAFTRKRYNKYSLLREKTKELIEGID